MPKSTIVTMPALKSLLTLTAVIVYNLTRRASANFLRHHLEWRLEVQAGPKRTLCLKMACSQPHGRGKSSLCTWQTTTGEVEDCLQDELPEDWSLQDLAEMLVSTLETALAQNGRLRNIRWDKHGDKKVIITITSAPAEK